MARTVTATVTYRSTAGEVRSITATVAARYWGSGILARIPYGDAFQVLSIRREVRA